MLKFERSFEKLLLNRDEKLCRSKSKKISEPGVFVASGIVMVRRLTPGVTIVG